LKVPGGQLLHGAELDLSAITASQWLFSIAALRTEGETRILGSECAAISYPDFFSTLQGLVER